MNKHTYAAGILPCSWNGNEIVILLGKDNYNTYSDFGGKADTSDCKLPHITAAREMYEETLGIFYDHYEICCMVHNGPYILSRSFTNKPYYMYLLWIPFKDSYVLEYNTAYNYVCSIPGMSHQYKEKTLLSWFSLREVMYERNKLPLRNVFYKTVQNNKRKIMEIALELKGRNVKSY